jgi:hypothetical protein
MLINKLFLDFPTYVCAKAKPLVPVRSRCKIKVYTGPKFPQTTRCKYLASSKKHGEVLEILHPLCTNVCMHRRLTLNFVG